MRVQSVICARAKASASAAVAPRASVSRSGVSSGTARCERTNAVQSRTRRLHHGGDRLDVGLPGGPLLGEDAAPSRGEPVETALPFARLFHPAPLDQPAVLEPQQRWI